jgi:ATP-binding cassette subfamily F protein uup
VVAGPHREPDWTDSRLLESFWFDSDVQNSPVRLLSGGERRRLLMLVVLAAKPNVLLLDEPTNDLDIDTLRSLEDLLDDWPGAAVVVSHDRAFLERTVTDVLVFDGAGRVGRRPGGYAAWEQERRAARSAPAAKKQRRPEPRPAEASDRSRRDASTASRRRRASRALGATEREMERLATRHAGLSADVAAVGDDHEALARLGAELAEVEAEQRAAEERWLELADEVENLG